MNITEALELLNETTVASRGLQKGPNVTLSIGSVGDRGTRNTTLEVNLSSFRVKHIRSGTSGPDPERKEEEKEAEKRLKEITRLGNKFAADVEKILKK